MQVSFLSCFLGFQGMYKLSKIKFQAAFLQVMNNTMNGKVVSGKIGPHFRRKSNFFLKKQFNR